jgi:hypothetical protein
MLKINVKPEDFSPPEMRIRYICATWKAQTKRELKIHPVRSFFLGVTMSLCGLPGPGLRLQHSGSLKSSGLLLRPSKNKLLS